MAKKGVSSKTHTQKQIDDYANQHNPNNKAYQAQQANREKMTQKNRAKSKANKVRKCQNALLEELGVNVPIVECFI